MPDFEVGSRSIMLNSPYVVLHIKDDKPKPWAVVSPDTMHVHKRFSYKTSAVDYADELGSQALGIVILNQDDSLDRFVPRENQWNRYSKAAIQEFYVYE